MIEIRNLTPHTVTLLINEEFVELKPEGEPCPRVSTVETTICSEPFVGLEVSYETIENLPPQVPGVALIVSKICCDAAPWRRDLWYPTRLVRDEEGNIVGCKALARNP